MLLFVFAIWLFQFSSSLSLFLTLLLFPSVSPLSYELPFRLQFQNRLAISRLWSLPPSSWTTNKPNSPKKNITKQIVANSQSFTINGVSVCLSCVFCSALVLFWYSDIPYRKSFALANQQLLPLKNVFTCVVCYFSTGFNHFLIALHGFDGSVHSQQQQQQPPANDGL